MKKLSPILVQAIQNAVYRSFWRKKALRDFLRRSGISSDVLARLNPEATKNQWLDEIFPTLEGTVSGQRIMLDMGRTLCEQKSFPDLEGYENSSDLIPAAKKAVSTLKDLFAQLDADVEAEKQSEEIRRKALEEQKKNIAARQTLDSLTQRLNDTVQSLGTQSGGYEFERWFFELMHYFEVDYRRPYKATDGRQIDGSVTIEGTTYLIELKFTASPVVVTDIDSILKKVTDKADNTMGIVVSMSGYTEGAIKGASYSRSPLLLLDALHLYYSLSGAMSFPDVVSRVRRHSSQEGIAFLPVREFGG